MRPERSSLPRLEWAGLAALGLVLVAAAWVVNMVRQIPLLAAGVAAVGVIAISAAIAGVSWAYLGQLESPLRWRAQAASLALSAVLAVAITGVIAWAGVSGSDTTATWSDFLDQLLAGTLPSVAADTLLVPGENDTQPVAAGSAALAAPSSAPVTPSAGAISTATVAPTAPPVTPSPQPAAPTSRPVRSVSPPAAATPRAAASSVFTQLDAAMLAAAAGELRTTTSDLALQLAGGQSLREIAASRAVPFTVVQGSIIAAVRPVLVAAVQRNALSSAQQAAIVRAISSPQFGANPGLPKA